VLITLEKLYNQKKFLSEIDKVHSKLKDNCKRKDLEIKCYEKNCACPTKRRDHFKKYSWKRQYNAGQKKKNPLGRKNGSFLEDSRLKEKLQKSVLYVEDQVTLQKIARKRRKLQNFLSKHGSMQMILLSRM